MSTTTLINTLTDVSKVSLDVAESLKSLHESQELLTTLKRLEGVFVRGLADVWTSMNALRPVNRLPPELLARIFSFVPDEWVTKLYDASPWGETVWPFRFKISTQLYLAIAVCRHWRNVALDTPTLWSDVCMTDTKLSNYKKVYERFAHCLLNVFIERHDGRWGARATDFLRTHGPRLRQIHLYMTDRAGNRQEALSTICSLPAQELEHCALAIDGVTVDERSVKLFSGYGARLRSLLISGLPFLPSNSFPALRHLVLEHSSQTNWNMMDLLTFLSGCPSLERCYLHLPDFAEVGPSDLPFVSLHALRLLSTRSLGAPTSPTSNVPVIRDFFAHIDCPNVVYRSIDLFTETHLPDLMAYLHAPSQTPYTKLLVETSHPDFELLKFGEARSPKTLSFQPRYTLTPGTSVQGLFAKPFLFRAIEEYWIISHQHVDVEDWGATLRFLPALRGLVVVYPASFHRLPWRGILRYLSGSPASPAPCGMLDTFCLCTHTVYERPHIILPYLSDMLRARREAGCPIRRVVLGYPRPVDTRSESKLSELEGLVDELVLLWNVGIKDMYGEWLRRVPVLLDPASPVCPGWAQKEQRLFE